MNTIAKVLNSKKNKNMPLWHIINMQYEYMTYMNMPKRSKI